MPRRSKGPWKRKQDDCYYTHVNGKQVKLTEPGESYEVAKKRYHEVHANAERPTNEVPTTVAQILDEFLEWTQQNQEASTYRWYLNYLRKFHQHVGSRLLVSSLK
ncbi:MAG: hypothetical protein KDB27_09625 [Planctomycetales bacterium]|nr:hypothetical protein [Planctomycetales bacterium]